MAQVFISYATPDSAFTTRLAMHLQQLGHTVWLDRWEINTGDWIPGKIAVGITQTEYLVVVLSKHTEDSKWVSIEVQIKFWEEVSTGRSSILPVVIDDCVIPALLRPKRAADFRYGYEVGLAQIANALSQQSTPCAKTEKDIVLAPAQLVALSLSSGVIQEYTGGSMSYLPKLTEVNVELSLPYVGKVAGVWKPAEEEQKAAWDLYVELVTRVSVAGLPPGQGLLRESLTSLHAIFTLTREILRQYGPTVARPAHGSEMSFGALAVQILNYVLRPYCMTSR